MKFFKVLFKIFIICTLLTAIITASMALYIKFYGKDLLKDVLSNLLKTRVEFENITISPERYTINFKGFRLPDEIDFGGGNVFNAETFSLALNEERFRKDGKVVLDKIIIKKGILNIIRNRKGEFNISRYYNIDYETDYNSGIAYADEQSLKGAGKLYDFAKSVKALYIQDSIIVFKDYLVPRGPFSIKCDNFNVTITSKPEDDPRYNAIPLKCQIDFEIPTGNKRGRFALDAEMSVLRKRVDVDMQIQATQIDLMKFLPYFNSYTPFSFSEGVFSSKTDLSVKDNMIDSLTTMVFHKLKLVTDPGKENTRFLETSVNKLAPYLMSNRGEIIFDFVIKGSLAKPRIGLGPRAKFAIGLVVIEELGNLFEQIQKIRGIK